MLASLLLFAMSEDYTALTSNASTIERNRHLSRTHARVATAVPRLKTQMHASLLQLVASMQACIRSGSPENAIITNACRLRHAPDRKPGCKRRYAIAGPRRHLEGIADSDGLACGLHAAECSSGISVRSWFWVCMYGNALQVVTDCAGVAWALRGC